VQRLGGYQLAPRGEERQAPPKKEERKEEHER